MTYPDRLAAELRRVGITGRHSRRIVLEIEDHLASDLSAVARLGDPAFVAARFADELASTRAKRAALTTFVGLAGVAAALAVPVLVIGRAGGYPDLFGGRSAALVVLAGVAVFIGPQIAFVAGCLALTRALRGRDRVIAAAEARLIERRAAVALSAGATAALGTGLYAVDFGGVLPGWWTGLALGCAAVCVPLTAFPAWQLRRAGAVRSSVPGQAGDLSDDLPLLRRLEPSRRPWRLCAVVGVPVVAAALAVGWIAEGAAVQGVVRAVPEGIAFVLAFATLRRYLGISR